MNKNEILENAKKKIKLLLNTLEKPIEFERSELYIINEEIYKNLLDIDLLLIPLRTESRRGKAYDINKIVNIINPKTPAISYKLVKAEKYTYVSDKTKCLDKLEVEKTVSENFYRKRVKEQIKDNDYSDLFIKKINEELEQLIEDENNIIDEIIKNPNKYSIRICGYKDRITYGQINYVPISIKNDLKSKKEKTINKHLSTVYPNILIYRHEDIDNKRSDMEVKYLEKEGFSQVAKRIFIKKIAD